MAETITEHSEGVWYWGESDPKTATIIGAFCDPPKVIKDGYGIEKTTAAAAGYGFSLRSEEVMPTQKIIEQAFAEMKGEEYDDDPESIQKTIVDALHGIEADEMRGVLQELGQLAGDTSETSELELRAGDLIEREDSRYEAIPLLRELSQLAIERVAISTDDGPGYFAPSPKGINHHPFFREPRDAA